MQAIRVHQAGGPDVLSVDDVATPVPKNDEVLVRLEAIGINYIDVYFRTGTYAAATPFTPGMEGAGIVEATGPDVVAFVPGERVAWAQQLGSYAQYALVPESKLVRVPDGVDARVAASLMLQGMTAHYLSRDTFALGPGMTALVHAGAGGVGLLLTQAAKALGATVITTVSTDAKAEKSRRAGADHVINYTQVDFSPEARRLTNGRGVDVVYDSVGKTTFDGSLDALRPRGMLALFGASSGPVPPFNLQLLNPKGSLFVTRPSLAHYVADPHELRGRADEVFGWFLAGKLHVDIAHEYPLGDAARAHTDLESRATTGKLLLLPAA